MSKQNAALVLENGKSYHGHTIGNFSKVNECDDVSTLGEIIFNTSMSGYQEIITDPSYKKQIICFTYPSIGNYGINNDDYESKHVYLSGLVVKDYCQFPSNFKSTMSLDNFLKKNKILGISGVDTRKLVLDIREEGELRAGIFLYPESMRKKTDESFTKWVDACVTKVCSTKSLKGQNLTKEFKGEHIKTRKTQNLDSCIKIAILDFGIKNSIIASFLKYGIEPHIFSGDVLYTQWANFNPNEYAGFFLSNGPGDPSVCINGIQNTKYLLSLGKPMFGICLGHQIISIALGATTYKMKFGHHGANQPVKREKKLNIRITSQNHGFAVDSTQLEKLLNEFQQCDEYSEMDIEKNLNDKTIEGFYVKTNNYHILSIQYHPEASPGPHDGKYNFHRFKQMLQQ